MWTKPCELQVRKNLAAPDQELKSFYSDSGIWTDIVHSQIFETGMLAVISINALWIAADSLQDVIACFINWLDLILF